MWRFLLMAVVGAALAAGAVFGDRVRQRNQAYDVRNIAAMQVKLDSVRAQYLTATTASDSTRLKAEIDARVYGIGRWQYHVPIRQRTLDSWWTASGIGTWLVVAGAVLIFSGLALARRTARR